MSSMVSPLRRVVSRRCAVSESPLAVGDVGCKESLTTRPVVSRTSCAESVAARFAISRRSRRESFGCGFAAESESCNESLRNSNEGIMLTLESGNTSCTAAKTISAETIYFTFELLKIPIIFYTFADKSAKTLKHRLYRPLRRFYIRQR